MKQHSLTRRLIAGTVGLMIGLVGAAAFTAPAHAEEDGSVEVQRHVKKSKVEFLDDCEGTTITIQTGKFLKTYKWTVSVDGETFEDLRLGRGESDTVFVPSDAGELIKVDFRKSPKGWPVKHTWTEPEDCDEPGEPEEPEVPVEGVVTPSLDCEAFSLTITNETDEEVTLTVVTSDGDSVDVTVPGNGTSDVISFTSSEGLVVDVHLEGESVLVDGPFEVTSEIWAALECDDVEPGERLPETGLNTGLIALGALVLLALGGGLFMLARRRRVTFTAA